MSSTGPQTRINTDFRYRWSRIKELFEQAVDLDPAERGAWVEQACNGDRKIRAELLSLLEYDETGDPFLETPIQTCEAGEGNPANGFSRLRAGSRIKSWTIVEKVGSGGMGEVYLAERMGEDDPDCKQLAAIKLIKLSADMECLRKRFQAERRIVAALNHPAIARLLESGVLDDGTPYFALDYVKGRQIDQYCQSLDLQCRLKVFCKVCETVAYAHQNLVVHCDLKPSNILVSGDGMPHLLDFGVARLLAEAGDNGYQTQTLWPCSPRYSSPEQIQNEAVNTATDVFALGIILCELVTGIHPFDPDETGKGFDVVERICRNEPEIRIRPTLQRGWGARQLASELELIIRKALSRKPEERYASVQYLVDDIECCLSQRPISLKGNQLLYRTLKLIQRHPGASIASAAATLMAISTVVVMLWSGRVAQEESKYALQQRSLALASAQTMIDDFAAALERLSAPTKERAELLKKVAAVFDQLEGTNKPGLSATADQRVAQAQGSIRTALRLAGTLVDLGDRDGAMEEISSAEMLVRELRKERVAEEQINLLAAEVLVTKGEFENGESKSQEPERDVEEALNYLRKTGSLGHESQGWKRNILLCRAFTLRGDFRFHAPKAEAEKFYQEAVAIGEKAYRQNSEDPELIDAYATALQSLGIFYRYAYRWDLIKEPIERALTIRRTAAERSPMNARLRLQLDRATAAWADEFNAAGSHSDVESNRDRAATILRNQCKQDPDNVTLQKHLIGALTNAAQFAAFRHHFKSAIPSLSEAVDIGRRLRSRGVGDQELGETLFRNVCWLIWCTSLSGDPASAIRLDKELLEPLESELEASCHDQLENSDRRGYKYTAKAFAAVSVRKWDEAQVFAKQVLVYWDGSSDKTLEQSKQELFAIALGNLGEFIGCGGDYSAACVYLVSSVGILRNLASGDGYAQRQGNIEANVADAEDALRYFQARLAETSERTYIPFLTTEIQQ